MGSRAPLYRSAGADEGRGVGLSDGTYHPGPKNRDGSLSREHH
jgi:hypothetical protein